MSDAPIVQVGSDAVIYRASSLGSCLRRLWASRMGYAPKAPPPALQKVFDEGHELEASILYALVKEHGWQIVPGSEQQELTLHIGSNYEDKQLFIVGHVDAIGRPPGGNHDMPIDAKAFAQSTMDKFMGEGILSFPHYVFQQSFYATAYGVGSFCMPLWNKDKGILENVMVYDKPPAAYDELADRIYHVEYLAENNITAPEIQCTADWGCPYDYLHDVRPQDALEANQEATARAYLAVTSKIKELEGTKKILSTQLLEHVPYTDDLRSFTANGVTVSVVNNPKRLNTQAVKELLTSAEVPLEDFYTEGSGVSVRVTAKEFP